MFNSPLEIASTLKFSVFGLPIDIVSQQKTKAALPFTDLSAFLAPHALQVCM